jgi:hypothetical protein
MSGKKRIFLPTYPNYNTRVQRGETNIILIWLCGQTAKHDQGEGNFSPPLHSIMTLKYHDANMSTCTMQ